MLLRTYLLFLCLFGTGIFGEAQTKKVTSPPAKTKEKAAIEEVNEIPVTVSSTKKAHHPLKPPPPPKKSVKPVPPPPPPPIKKAAPLPRKPSEKPQQKTLAKPPAPPSASYPLHGTHHKAPDAPPPMGSLA